MLFFFCFCFFFLFAFGVEIENQQSTQKWWTAFYVNNVNTGCGSLTNVEIKDCCAYSSWYSYTGNEHGYYSFNNNANEIKLPLSVRLTNSAGQKLILTNIITTFNGGQKFSSSQNLCSGGGQQTTTTTTTSPTTSTSSTSPNTGDLTCVTANPSNFNWKANNFKLLLNGKEFKMKGVSWFGFDSDTFIVHGLASWANGGRSYKDLFDFLVNNKFNAIRLPFSEYLVVNNPNIASHQINGPGNSIFNGKKALQAMDIIIDEAGKRGILIMLDYHSKNFGSHTDGFKILNQNYARTQWKKLAQRYKNRWNVFMADIYNEPHDVSNSEWNQWKGFCQNVGNDLIAEGVNWLFAVQGTNWQCSLASCYWGENLEAVKNNPVILTKTNRVVYSPHVYGLEPNNAYSNSIWDAHFGYIAKQSISKSGQTIKAPIVVGEYGTKYSTNSEKTWLNTFVNYLKNSLKQPNTFFWCLNPNSGDTGGLLKSDWTSPETAKLNKLNELQPNPTKFYYNSNTNKVCWNDGSSSNNNAVKSNNNNKLENFDLTQDVSQYDWSEWVVLLLIIIGCLSCLLILCFIALVVIARKYLVLSKNQTAQKIGNAAIRYSTVVQRRLTVGGRKATDINKNDEINNNNVNDTGNPNNNVKVNINNNLDGNHNNNKVTNQTNIVAEKDSSDDE